jgi:hypothetical protein
MDWFRKWEVSIVALQPYLWIALTGFNWASLYFRLLVIIIHFKDFGSQIYRTDPVCLPFCAAPPTTFMDKVSLLVFPALLLVAEHEYTHQNP